VIVGGEVEGKKNILRVGGVSRGEELAKCDGMRVYPSQIRTPPIPDFQCAQLKECHYTLGSKRLDSPVCSTIVIVGGEVEGKKNILRVGGVYPSQIRTPPIPDFQCAQLKECH
jgi:hypothetical protein